MAQSPSLRKPPVPASPRPVGPRRLLRLAIGLLALVLASSTVAAHASLGATLPSSGGAPQTQAQASYPFQTLPAASPLPTEAACAAVMDQQHSPAFEPRPENAAANATNVYATGYRFPAQALDGFGARVTGNFTGTTDEIIQWAACKWGFDPDTVRAQAMQESGWDQAYLGDCHPGQATQPETAPCASFGLMQVKGANLPPDHPNTYPQALLSTAFNVDYTLAVRRRCFEGRISWLNSPSVRAENGRQYVRGDEWGCMGLWYSGRWHDAGATRYLYQQSDLGRGVQTHYEQQTWLRISPER